MKNTIIFVICGLFIISVLYILSEKHYPRMPLDDIHNTPRITNSGACLDCHGPGKKAALKKTHPPKFECYKCHQMAQKR